MTDLQAFKGNSLVNADLFKRMMQTTETLAGSGGGESRRISIKGGRFREMINGEQIRVNSSGSMNVVIVRTSGVIRTYYEGAYDPEKASAPTCWSSNSESPDAAVSAENRKASVCRDCPMNIKGSGANGGRACRFSARLAVCLENDYDKVYQLQIPATSIFGDEKDGHRGMQAYARFLKANEMPMGALVTTMYFDENSETPKLFFKAARPLDEDEMSKVVEQMDSEAATKAITLTVYQQDAGDESAPAPKKAAKPEPKQEAAPVEDGEDDEVVDEPALVEAKPKVSVDTSKLADTLSGWDD